MNTSKQINIMILVVFLSVLATGAYTLWDQTRANEAESEQLETTIWRGAWLFSQNCRTCHGDAGEGGLASGRLRVAPALNREDLQGLVDGVRDPNEFANDYKFVYYTITCGRVGKVMPVWGQSQGGSLNEEQIKQLTTLILNGSIPYEDLTDDADETPDDGDGAGSEESSGPETGWDQAVEFARHGVPEYHEEGDDRNELALAEAISASDTELVLNHVLVGEEGAQTPAIQTMERLAIVDEEGETVELLNVTAVDAEANTITVERGVGGTEAGDFPAGTQIHNQPALTEGEIVERSCGQTAGAPAEVDAGPPVTALTIVARGIAWSKTALAAVANAPLTISVDHQDVDILHNWRIYGNPEGEGDPIAGTEIENGPVMQTLSFGPLDAGEYYYDCEVHPQMNGILTASVPGAATPADGSTPAADTTPAVEATATP